MLVRIFRDGFRMLKIKNAEAYCDMSLYVVIGWTVCGCKFYIFQWRSVLNKNKYMIHIMYCKGLFDAIKYDLFDVSFTID